MIAAIVARLRDQVGTLSLISGAADFQKAAEANPTATPAAYVLLLTERGGPPATFSRTEQRVDAEIGIVLVTRNLADTKGAAAGTDMATLRAAVRTALLGWEDAGRDPMEYGAGGLLAFRDGHMWWQDSYRTRYDITS